MTMTSAMMPTTMPTTPTAFESFRCTDNRRKRYAVIESLELMRNISWIASYFSKIKKPNKHCSGNQSMIADDCFEMIYYIYP